MHPQQSDSATLETQVTHDNARVCLDGHVQTLFSSVHLWLPEQCACGAPIASRCDGCKSPIPGGVLLDGKEIPMTYGAPAFCPFCETPFIWTSNWAALRSRPNNLISRLMNLLEHFEDSRLEAGLELPDEAAVVRHLRGILAPEFADVEHEAATGDFAQVNGFTDIRFGLTGVQLSVKHVVRASNWQRQLDSLIAQAIRHPHQQSIPGYVIFVYDPHGEIQNPRVVRRDLQARLSTPSLPVFVSISSPRR